MVKDEVKRLINNCSKNTMIDIYDFILDNKELHAYVFSDILDAFNDIDNKSGSLYLDVKTHKFKVKNVV